MHFYCYFIEAVTCFPFVTRFPCPQRFSNLRELVFSCRMGLGFALPLKTAYRAFGGLHWLCFFLSALPAKIFPSGAGGRAGLTISLRPAYSQAIRRIAYATACPAKKGRKETLFTSRPVLAFHVRIKSTWRQFDLPLRRFFTHSILCTHRSRPHSRNTSPIPQWTAQSHYYCCHRRGKQLQTA